MLSYSRDKFLATPAAEIAEKLQKSMDSPEISATLAPMKTKEEILNMIDCLEQELDEARQYNMPNVVWNLESQISLLKKVIGG